MRWPAHVLVPRHVLPVAGSAGTLEGKGVNTVTEEVLPKFISGWIQIRHRMRGPGGDIINTFSCRPPSTTTRYTGSQLSALAVDFANTFLPLLRPLMGAGVTFVDVIVNDLYDEFGEQGSYTYPANTVGTSAGEQLPSNVAIASTYRTKYRGPAYRGRNFWGGFTEAATNGDVFVSAFVAALYGVIQQWLFYRGPGAVPVLPVVASRTKQKVNDLTAAVLTSVMDSQRRRLTGHGR